MHKQTIYIYIHTTSTKITKPSILAILWAVLHQQTFLKLPTESACISRVCYVWFPGRLFNIYFQNLLQSSGTFLSIRVMFPVPLTPTSTWKKKYIHLMYKSGQSNEIPWCTVKSIWQHVILGWDGKLMVRCPHGFGCNVQRITMCLMILGNP